MRYCTIKMKNHTEMLTIIGLVRSIISATMVKNKRKAPPDKQAVSVHENYYL